MYKFIFLTVLSHTFYIYLQILSLTPVTLQCQQVTPAVYDHLVLQTPYRHIENDDITPLTYPGCTAKKIWMMTRHGTRFPGTQDIKIMQQELVALRNAINDKSSTLCLDKRKAIRSWSMPIEPSMNKMLAVEGGKELWHLAERMQKRFGELFPNEYSNRTYRFKYTKTERAEQSARNFTAGLFGLEASQKIVYPEPEEKDLVLRFYKACNKWQKDVRKNPANKKEAQAFANSFYMQTVSEQVSTILGLNDCPAFDDILTIYKICGYETAWKFQDRLSPWCHAIPEKLYSILEYYVDIRHYWRDGYAYRITYEQACLCIKDIFQFFSEPESHKTTVYFSHSGTMLKLLAFFGLYNDHETLRSDNFLNMTSRKWRGSEIDTFGSNLALVLYDCEDGEKVGVLHQERPVQLPYCSGELCDLNALKIQFNDALTCDFDRICENNRF